MARPGTTMHQVADDDRAGVHVVGVENTTTIRAAMRSLKLAWVTAAKTVAAGIDMLRSGQSDAIALSRNSPLGLVASVPAAR